MRLPLVIDLGINPLAFLELGIVLAFGVGWLALEAVARRADNKSKRAAERQQMGRPPQ